MVRSLAFRWVAVLLLLLVVGLAAPRAARADGDVNFFLGQKSLNKDDWDPMESQSEFGAEVTFGKKDWPIDIAIDLFSSSDDVTSLGVKVEGSTMEFGVGVRKIWKSGNTMPYFGGGLASISGKFKVDAVGLDESDSSLGAWFGGGVFWRLGPRFNIGIAARYSKATITLFDVDGEGGGIHYGLILGWGWPASK